ncbi:MAG: Flp family type IVb pilin [Pelagibacterium sp.]|jgi:pilus assembly protein Flp/PilA|uniref:Flp family type IVb pilin n=1 Tax=Pelagibacterium sp. TaxID=1967288 RepID=UPI0032F07925|tara:strand:+ start:7436 stop:7633 length:198 start_codon:yes stop_codon:yes gene_type:complete
MNLFKKFVADESGATAIEYGLIAALVAVVVIAALTMLGGQLQTTFEEICQGLNAGEVCEEPAVEG